MIYKIDVSKSKKNTNRKNTNSYLTFAGTLPLGPSTVTLKGVPAPFRPRGLPSCTKTSLASITLSFFLFFSCLVASFDVEVLGVGVENTVFESRAKDECFVLVHLGLHINLIRTLRNMTLLAKRHIDRCRTAVFRSVPKQKQNKQIRNTKHTLHCFLLFFLLDLVASVAAILNLCGNCSSGSLNRDRKRLSSAQLITTTF